MEAFTASAPCFSCPYVINHTDSAPGPLAQKLYARQAERQDPQHLQVSFRGRKLRLMVKFSPSHHVSVARPHFITWGSIQCKIQLLFRPVTSHHLLGPERLSQV